MEKLYIVINLSLITDEIEHLKKFDDLVFRGFFEDFIYF